MALGVDLPLDATELGIQPAEMLTLQHPYAAKPRSEGFGEHLEGYAEERNQKSQKTPRRNKTKTKEQRVKY